MGRRREGARSVKQERAIRKIQFGSMLFDFAAPIRIIASTMIKTMMKELMSANSLAVAWIIGSSHDTLTSIKYKAHSMPNIRFINSLKLLRILWIEDVNLITK
jgi:hypothetical protein